MLVHGGVGMVEAMPSRDNSFAAIEVSRRIARVGSYFRAALPCVLRRIPV